jgi:16S rRNA (guanine527-N7)-methyltransferase
MSSSHPTPAADPGSLKASLARFGVSLDDERTIHQLEQYCRLLWAENEQLNLTRHLDFDTFVARDLNDARQVSSLLRPGEEVLDIGSGGGVPGIVLAICRPDLKVTLCESVGKKAQALERMIAALGLPVRLVHGRAEELLRDERFDAAIARAVGPLWKICYWFQDHLLAMGRLLAFKGARWEDELAEARRHPAFHKLQFRVALEYPMLGTDSRALIIKLWAKGAPEK